MKTSIGTTQCTWKHPHNIVFLDWDGVIQVKDKQSGLVVQGMEDECDEEEVVHIVRFEVVTDKSDEDRGKTHSDIRSLRLTNQSQSR